MSDKTAPRVLVWAAVSTMPQADEDERFSLTKQVDDGRAFVESIGGHLVDVLVVPGHSRSYRSLEQLAAHARAKNIDAFDKLIDHLDDKDFDVLWCRDADRFARTASLMHLIVETIIEDCKASIYSSVDGWVTSDNADIFAMVKGYTTNQAIKSLVKYRHHGMKKRAERGARVGPNAPFPFKPRLNEAGKEIGIEPNRDLQHVIDDFVDLFLEGVAWDRLELEGFRRFGHGRNNKPYGHYFIREMFHRSAFWGHSAWNVFQNGKNLAHSGNWMFDLTEEPPPGVYRFPNTHEPYYTGDKAERIKAELRRRREIRGRRSPSSTPAFSGLMVCAVCTYTLAVNNRPRSTAYRCLSSYKPGYENRLKCTNTGYIHASKIRAWFEPRLQHLIETGDISQFVAEVEPDGQENEAYLTALRMDVERLTENARELLNKTVPPALQSIYEQELLKLSDELGMKQARLAEVERRIDNRSGITAQQHMAIHRLKEMGLATFWEQESRVINQILQALLGDFRLAVLNKEIVRIVPKPPHYRTF